jgi:hypothetical protein
VLVILHPLQSFHPVHEQTVYHYPEYLRSPSTMYPLPYAHYLYSVWQKFSRLPFRYSVCATLSRPALSLSMISPVIPRQQSRNLPVVWIFPPSSPLHARLFVPMSSSSLHINTSESVLGDIPPLPLPPLPLPGDATLPFYSSINPAAYLPRNERLIEGLENVWLRLHSGGIYLKGVLLLTTHRLIFIQYAPPPSQYATSHTIPEKGFLLALPLCQISSTSLLRRWNERFHALLVECLDRIGYLFICVRDQDELRTLEAFRRIKIEVRNRNEFDAFAAAIDITFSAPRGIRASKAAVESCESEEDSGEDISAETQQAVTHTQLLNLDIKEDRKKDSCSPDTPKSRIPIGYERVVQGLINPFDIGQEYDR